MIGVVFAALNKVDATPSIVEIIVALGGGATIMAVLRFVIDRRKVKNAADKEEREAAVEGFGELTQWLNDTLKSEREEWQRRLDAEQSNCVKKMDDLEKRMQRRISAQNREIDAQRRSIQILQGQVLELGGTPNA